MLSSLPNSFNELCFAILNQVAPYKTSQEWLTSSFHTPWLNNQSCSLLCFCWKAQRLWKSTGLIVHRESNLKNSEWKLLQLHNESVKEARFSYFNKLINHQKNNSRVFFETINSIVSPQLSVLLSDCNTFLNDFVNKVVDLRSKVSSSASPYEGGPQYLESFTSFSPITPSDLTTVIG